MLDSMFAKGNARVKHTVVSGDLRSPV
jgi:hypothetical protein